MTWRVVKLPPSRDAFDVVDDVVFGVAGKQEIAVQRMDGAVLADRLPGGGKRLAQHLAAVDALPADAGAGAAKQIVLEPLETEGRDEASRAD